MTMLAKWLRKASSLFTEKPEAKSDDFGLEHILLYHCLAGTSPENQRAFKDVRADILSAIGRKNSQNLCINLKIAPLWWEDKLQRIFAEAKDTANEATINTLLPVVSAGQETSELDPLMHSDWRVRANAAGVISYLGAHQGQERIIQALDDTASSANPAFCHISRALAGFRTVLAREALAKHLCHKEPWIRVDIVSALSNWPLSDVSPLIISAFVDHHDFMDYSAVALARLHKPIVFVESRDQDLIDVGAGIIIGLLEAVAGPFSSNPDMLIEVEIQKCLVPLQNAAGKNTTPLRLRALSQLAEWLQKNYHQYRLEAYGYPSQEIIAEAKQAAADLLDKLDMEAAIKKSMETTNARAVTKATVRHAIKLSGERKQIKAVPILLKLLDDATVYQNEIIEALGRIGNKDCAPALIKLAKQTVNLEQRTQLTLSANPINESEPEKAKTYWYILAALGNLESDDTLDLLLEGSQDEASDKREEALSSLIKLWNKTDGKLAKAEEVKKTLQKCLSDPSAQVRIKAMEGAAALDLNDLIPAVARLVNAQEMSVNRAAFSTLEQLAKKGKKEAIRKALNEAKSGQNNAAKVKRIDQFIQHHL